MTVKTKIPAVHYGNKVDHLFIGLDNNAVASRNHINHWPAGQYVMNFARLDNRGNYLFNIGICTGEYEDIQSESIWEDYNNATVHPVEWFNELPILVNKNELPENTFAHELVSAQKPVVWDLLLSKIEF